MTIAGETIKFLLKMFWMITALCLIYKIVIGIMAADTHTCTDTQMITKLEPLLAKKYGFKYLITGDKGTKVLSSGFMSEEETLALKVGDKHCFKETHNFNWNKFLESFTKL